jgi:hypothetical protein
MAERDGEPVLDSDTVIVERGSGGGLVATVALLIALLAVLYYFGLLPF